MSAIALLLALGVAVVVPLTLLCVRPPASLPDMPRPVLVVGTAVAAAASLALDAPAATALAAPWVVLTGCLAGAVARRSLPAVVRTVDLDHLVDLAAHGFLAFGAFVLLLDRAGLDPFGNGDVLVRLTAVHFHYAGFVALALTDRVRRETGTTTAALAAVLLVAAPPTVALGFQLVPLLQVVGAVLLELGLLLAAVATFRLARGAPRPHAVALVLGAACSTVAMALAVHWAAGTVHGFAVLDIATMARTHGVLQALGYTLPTALALATLPPATARGGAASTDRDVSEHTAELPAGSASRSG